MPYLVSRLYAASTKQVQSDSCFDTRLAVLILGVSEVIFHPLEFDSDLGARGHVSSQWQNHDLDLHPSTQPADVNKASRQMIL